MKTVLFTGGGGAGNEAIDRLYAGRYRCLFADADPAAIAPSIPSDRRFTLPRADAGDFAEATAALCRAEGVDLVLLGVDEELPHAPAIRVASPNTAVIPADPAFTARALDKAATAWTLAEAGLPAPRTLLGDRAEKADYPCIVKPRSGRGSRGVAILEAPAQVAAYLALNRLEPDQIVLQELMRGREYTVQMAADAAGALGAVAAVAVGVKRGVTLRAETADAPGVVAACRAVHEAFPAAGCYNIQGIETAEGRFVPFEINPRISTTFCLGVAAGLDPIAVYFEGAGAAPVVARPGVTLTRSWTNHFGERDA